MNTVGSNQNCQLKSTRRNTVRSHVVFRDSPRRRIAHSFSSSVKKRADLWCGRSGMANQPKWRVNGTDILLRLEIEHSPNRAKGIVITETTMNIHLHGGNDPLPLSDASKAAWIQPPAMLPKLPKPQNTAARVPSSDCLYHEPYMKCAPTLQMCQLSSSCPG